MSTMKTISCGLLLIFTIALGSCASDYGFRVKSDGVYFRSSDGNVALVYGAGPKNFRALTDVIGWDGSTIYRGTKPIGGAYFGTYPQGSGTAKTAIYDEQGKVVICDYPTFRKLDDSWQVDSKCAYWHNEVLEKSVPENFHPLSPLLAKDKSHVYMFNNIFSSADAPTFELMCRGSWVSGRDKDHCYWYTHQVACDCKPHNGAEFRK